MNDLPAPPPSTIMAHIAVHGSRKMGGVDDDSNNMVLAVKEIWEKMHPNGNNEVERDDIAMGFEEAVKHKLSAEELDELMSEVDADGGGSVRYMRNFVHRCLSD